MTQPDPNDQAFARQARFVALVIAGAGVLAILAPWLTQALGLAPRFEFLFYLIAMGAFVWAMVVLARMWNKRRNT